MAVIVTRRPLIICLIVMSVLALTICISDIVCCILLVVQFPKDAVPVISASISVVVLQSFLLVGALAIILFAVLGVTHILNFRRDQTLMTFLILLFLSLFDLTMSAGLFWIQGSLSANLNNLYTMKAWEQSKSDQVKGKEMTLAESAQCKTYTGGFQAYLCGTAVNNNATTIVNINGIICLVCSLLMIATICFLLWYMKHDEEEPTPPPSKDPSVEGEYVEEPMEEYVPLTEAMDARGAMDLSLAYDGNCQVTQDHPGYAEWAAENPDVAAQIQ